MEPIDLLDLTEITRNDRTGATIYLCETWDEKTRRRLPESAWIKTSNIQLFRSSDTMSREWRVSGYLRDGATDFEHDSAYAFAFQLIGVELDMMVGGRTTVRAWIANAPEDFRVPPPGYDPLSLPGTEVCTECTDKHRIVPENFYLPPKNHKLHAKLIGRRITIGTGK